MRYKQLIPGGHLAVRIGWACYKHSAEIIWGTVLRRTELPANVHVVMVPFSRQAERNSRRC